MNGALKFDTREDGGLGWPNILLSFLMKHFRKGEKKCHLSIPLHHSIFTTMENRLQTHSIPPLSSHLLVIHRLFLFHDFNQLDMDISRFITSKRIRDESNFRL